MSGVGSLARALGGLAAHPSRLPRWRTHVARALEGTETLAGVPLPRRWTGRARTTAPPRRPDVVAVLAGDRVRRLLSGEWHQVEVDPARGLTVDVLQRVDAVLVEWSGTDAGPSADDVTDAARAADAAGVPLVVWDTAAPDAPPVPVGGVPVLVDVAGRAPGGSPHETAGPTVDLARTTPVHAGRRRPLAVRGTSAGDAADALLAAALRDAGAVPATHDDTRRFDVTAVLGATRDGAWTQDLVDAAASGSAVVTADAHVAGALPGAVVVAGADEARFTLTALVKHEELRDRQAHVSTRAVLAAAGPGRRAEAVLRLAGRPGRVPSVSAVVPTMRPAQLDNVLDFLGRQTHPSVQLVLVTHGFTVDEADVRARAAERGLTDVVVVPADRSLTLGACMNLGVDAADGDHVAKMDDDNHYGPHYLADLLAAFEYTQAQVVGKWAHVAWLESTRTVLLRFPAAEHRYTPLVQGGTIVVPRAVAAELRFEDLPRRVDTTFLEKVTRAGGLVYSGDRYGFVSVRRSSPGVHTWQITDAELLAKPSRLLFHGEPWTYADV